MRLAVDFMVGETLYIACLRSESDRQPLVVPAKFLRIAKKHPHGMLRIITEIKGSATHIVPLKFVHKERDGALVHAQQMAENP